MSQFGYSPPTPITVFPTPDGGEMWVHPDLLDDQGQWTIVSCKRSKGKSKQANVIIASTIEPDSDVNSLTDSDREEDFLATDATWLLVATTRSGQPYLRNYDNYLAQQPEPTQEQVEEHAEQPKTMPKKPKEVWYNRPFSQRKSDRGFPTFPL